MKRRKTNKSPSPNAKEETIEIDCKLRRPATDCHRSLNINSKWKQMFVRRDAHLTSFTGFAAPRSAWGWRIHRICTCFPTHWERCIKTDRLIRRNVLIYK